MKYIVIEVRFSNDHCLEVPFIFPEFIVHADMADRMKQYLASEYKDTTVTTIAGGFVNSMEVGSGIRPTGESTSAKVKSRGNKDKQLITMCDYGSMNV